MTMLLEGLLIFLCMQLTWVSGQQLNQNPRSVSIQEGEDVSMSCNSSSTLNTFQWFKQDPVEGLVLVIALYKAGELTRDGKLTAQFSGTRTDSFLTISASETEHSGTYFCSANSTVLLRHPGPAPKPSSALHLFLQGLRALTLTLSKGRCEGLFMI
uniref:Ig-like domain-containing protein n=1 Tax=Canis lupus familiaris TaxID=9615 RepID=A0A8I3MJE6_CANLF